MTTVVLPGVYSPGEFKVDPRDAAILSLWKDRKDTRDIASALNMRESAVANRLARLRDQGAR
jgi:DNA-binding Lrp family transcriptional regulator